MYTKFYGLKFKPFDFLPDPRFLYLSKKHEMAYAHLEYGITDNKPFIVLTGDVGTGKTTLINFFLKKVDSEVKTALIYNTNIDPQTFLEMVVRDFGIKMPGSKRSALYESLYEFLLHEHIQRRRCVLIIDEAQNMPKETLEEVRMLSNFETEESYLLQIIMAGQPQLRRRLNNPELAQLTQRVSVHYHLAPLEKSEIGSYIEHRLKVGGYESQHPLFSDEAIEKIHAYTQGVPRLINSICDSALLYGYGASLKTIDLGLVEEVLADRGIDPGIQHEEEEISRKEKGYPGRRERIELNESAGDHIYLQISNLNERLTRIEQRVSQLEDVENQHTASGLIEWLKEAQKENLKLQEKYSALLLRYKKDNLKKPGNK
jgi:general secretion pathway protein A